MILSEFIIKQQNEPVKKQDEKGGINAWKRLFKAADNGSLLKSLKNS